LWKSVDEKGTAVNRCLTYFESIFAAIER
jgi:hypothetical protein